jgi:hypothetical protein
MWNFVAWPMLFVSIRSVFASRSNVVWTWAFEYVGSVPRIPAGATGTVKKIAIKYVTVRNDRDGGLWKIPANMLEIVEGQMVTA